MNKTAREQIVDLLMTIEKEQTYAQLLLKEQLQNYEMKDKAFITEVVYGTLKYQIKLDYILNQFSKTPVRKMKPFIRNLMRMSVYQLFFLDKVPSSAVINEAVKLAKKRKFVTLAGFVNGLLRNIDRAKETIIYPSAEKEPASYLSIYYAFPEWMIKNWLKTYSFAETEEMVKALNARARVCIRVNHLKAEEAELIALLKAEGVAVQKGKLLEEALYIQKVNELQKMPSFKEGKWTVQDESAMLVAHVMDPKPGQHILDMCSAPGGKSMHMADLMQNEGEIISCDLHTHKMELINKQAERLGISIVKPTLQDGTCFNEAFNEAFDAVLLDAPCSGLGILKRKPDMRHHRQESDMEDIAAIQRALIDQAVKYVKKGGRLVYSTCTISRAENEEMVKYIQEKHGFNLNTIKPYIPKHLQNAIKEEGMIQILPQMVDTDGFFIASFQKENV